MGMEVDISHIESELTPAEQAVMKAMPPMVEKQFSKLVTILFATGVLAIDGGDKDGGRKKEDKNGLDVRVVIASLYTAMVGIASAKGTIATERAQAKVDATLRELMDKASFAYRETGDDTGCGEPDCPACGSASDETDNKSEVAPPGVTKH